MFQETCVLKQQEIDVEALRYIRMSLDEQLALADCCEDCAELLLSNQYGITPATLHLLSRNDEEWVRETVALNPNASPVTLRNLAMDSRGDIRAFVAENPSTPAPILEGLTEIGLAGGEDQAYLLRAIMENPNCPDELAGQCLFRLSMR